MKPLTWKTCSDYDAVRAYRQYVCDQTIDTWLQAGIRPVPGFANIFVSPDGDVFSSHRRTARKLRQGTKPGGYNFVYAGNGKYMMVHRLVALTFIPNPDNLPQVNHIDFNRSNNSVDNLEWVTGSQNQQHSMRHGRRPCGPAVLMPHITDEVRAAIVASPDVYRVIAQRYGCSAQTVCNIKRGKTQHEVANEHKS